MAAGEQRSKFLGAEARDASVRAAELPVSRWRQRLEHLADRLCQVGRRDLEAMLIMPMLGMLEQQPQVRDFDLLGQGIREIGLCMRDATRQPDPQLLAQLAPSQPTQEQGVETELLAALLGAEEDEVEAALDVWGTSLVVEDGLGTLREPLTRAAASGRVLMKGEVEPGLLGDLIQLFAQNRETGRLVVDGPGGEGNADFLDGSIVDASFGRAEGEAAFIELIAVSGGRFFWQRGIEPSRRTIERSTAHLLMDALRMLDERAAKGSK